MKRCTALIALIFCMAPLTVTAQTQSTNFVKNGDFEKFTGDNPVGWESSNVPGMLTVVSPQPMGRGGSRAVKCEVKDFYGSKIAGFVCQKNIEVTGKDLLLSGYYATRSVGKDAAVVIICFLNATGSTIGTVEEYFRENKTELTRFEKEINTPAETRMVHVRLTILAEPQAETLHPGSYAIFDDIKLVTAPPKPKAVVTDSLKVVND